MNLMPLLPFRRREKIQNLLQTSVPVSLRECRRKNYLHQRHIPMLLLLWTEWTWVLLVPPETKIQQHCHHLLR